MPTVGILTEKPSARRNFAKALGGDSGSFNGEDYIIANSRGHLYEFLKPESNVDATLSEKYGKWDIKNLPWDENDFLWKKGKTKGSTDTLKDIYNKLKDCDEIVIATDIDESGEGGLLAWEALIGLKLETKKKYSRMYFNDESVPEIQKAFKNRKPIADYKNDPEYKKADFRSKFDYMSMQFTRIATHFGDGHSVLRQGRLKSAMVVIVGDQLKAISEYKKIPSYQNRFKDENGVVYTNEKEPTYEKKEDVPNIYEKSVVIKDAAELKKTVPPKLLDLASLSARLAPKGIKSKTVLDTYQKMYENQIVSYPRTDDKKISIEQFNDLLPLCDDIARVVGVDPALLTHKIPRKTHIGEGMSHGANRPGTNVPASLDKLKDDYGPAAPLIYELLAKNYLATLCEDYVYIHETGHVEKYPDFKGSSNIPKEMGFKAVYNTDDEDEETSGKGLGTMAEPYIHELFPPKPQSPTMKWLMKQLEKHDIGTGATKTSTYSDVTNSNTNYPLLTDTKGKIDMTLYGKMSYILLKDTHIGDLKITEDVYADMREVEKGIKDIYDCLHVIQQMVIDDILTMEKNSKVLHATMSLPTFVKKEKHTGVWAKTGKEISFNKVWGDHTFSEDECKKLLDGETISISIKSKKSGEAIQIRGSLEEQKYKGKTYIGFSSQGFVEGEKEELDWKCPNCKKNLFSTERQISCECGFSINWYWGGKGYQKKLSEANMESIIKNGATGSRVNLKSKTGKPFSTIIALTDDRMGAEFAKR